MQYISYLLFLYSKMHDNATEVISVGGWGEGGRRFKRGRRQNGL